MWTVAALVIALAVAAPSIAAEKRARLTVNVTAQGTYHTQNQQGTDYADGKFSESYGFVTYFKSSGELEVYNTKDPTYGQKMMKRAEQARAAVAQAQGKTVPASDDDEDYDEDSDPETRYLSYFGYENCGASAYVKVDRNSSGAYADVQGMVPWKEKEHADYKADAVQVKMLCISGSPVVDTKAREVWGLMMLGLSARGAAERIDNGRKQDMGTDIKYGYGMEWVNQQLNSHLQAGSRTVTQKMGTPGGGHRNLGTTAGSATITVTWKWEELPN
jgi:hypothetical protein